MSAYIPRKNLSEEQQFYISQKLFVEEKMGRDRPPRIHYMYSNVNINNEPCIAVPFAFYAQIIDSGISEKPQKMYSSHGDIAPNSDLSYERIPGQINSSFEIKNDQKRIIRKAKKSIKRYRTVFLNLSCGYGKTCMAIALGQMLKRKWIFVAPRAKLIGQAKRDSNKVSNEIIQIIGDSKDMDKNYILDPDASGYIITVNKFRMIKPEQLLGIGTLILDEFHTLCTKGCYPKLFSIFPKYIIAMTATAYRKDGLDSMMNLFIDRRSYIKAEKMIPFDLFIYMTDLKLKSIFDASGTLNWTDIIKQQSSCTWRNRAITSLINHYITGNTKRRPLVLCKHKNQVRQILYFLSKHYPSISVDTLMGNKQDYDETAQVLITIMSKAGLGFDGDFDTCILACDITDPHQLVGRIGRREGREPIVIDFIDGHNRMWKHFDERNRWYQTHGVKRAEYGVLTEKYILTGFTKADAYLYIRNDNGNEKDMKNESFFSDRFYKQIKKTAE